MLPFRNVSGRHAALFAFSFNLSAVASPLLPAFVFFLSRNTYVVATLLYILFTASGLNVKPSPKNLTTFSSEAANAELIELSFTMLYNHDKYLQIHC